jgi:hypothetical protein
VPFVDPTEARNATVTFDDQVKRGATESLAAYFNV